MNSAQELLKGDSAVLTKQTPVPPNRLNFWSSWRIFTKRGTITTTTNTTTTNNNKFIRAQSYSY